MCLWIYRPDDAKRKKNVHDIINLFYKSQRNAKNQKQNNIIFKSSVKMTNFGLFIISVVKTKYNCEIHFCQNFQCFLFVYIYLPTSANMMDLVCILFMQFLFNEN